MTPAFFLSWFDNSLGYFLIVFPWLVLGVIISLLLKKFLNEKIVKKILGNSNVLTIIIAEIIGAFSPISVIALLPLSSTILSEGAAPATLIAFLLAARAYNPEALPISLSMLGMKITILNLLITFIAVTICSLMLKNIKFIIPQKENKDKNFLYQIFQFVGYVVIGIIIAGFIITAVPPHIVAQFGGKSIFSVPTTMFFGFLVYLGFVGYFPIAKTFLELGVTHAAVITFLNSASIVNLTFLLMFMPVIGKKNTIKIFFLYSFMTLLAGIILYILHV